MKFYFPGQFSKSNKIPGHPRIFQEKKKKTRIFQNSDHHGTLKGS